MPDTAAPFQRPAEWPTGWLHELGIRCPQCGDHYAVTVAASVQVRLTEGGADTQLSAHEYLPTSPAECGNCDRVGTLADFCAIPDGTQLNGVTAVSCEWSTGADDAGAAYWADLTFAQFDQARTLAAHYWPGVTIEVVDQILTVQTPDTFADSLLLGLTEALGEPDSIA